MRRTSVVILISLALVVLLVTRSAVIVDESEFVLVSEFGRPVATYGERSGEAGLHWKRPWQAARGVDRRLRVFDPPARELITGDRRNLEAAPYVAWRVVDPNRFVRSAGTPGAAEARLAERVSSALGQAIGARGLASVATTDPAVWALDALSADLIAAVGPRAREELGIEVVDVRLRRFNPPVEVRPAVFDLIRSERRQVAAALRAEGEAKYQTLVSAADRERDAILAGAEADAERARGRGDAEATRLLNEAHARDPKFYEFVRTLETYRAILDDRATVILSASSPLLKLLTQGPADDLMRDPPSPTSTPDVTAGGRGK